jgi:hypothetical protein
MKMSRSTQHIGLTLAAKLFVEKNAIKVCEENVDIVHERIGTDMFDDAIMGEIFNLTPFPGPNKALIAKEELQFTAWSSGMMIFTHLHLFLIKECGQKLDMGYIFSWVKDPTITNEYDHVIGHYWL